MIDLSAADAVISTWNNKYYWKFWRPMAAIRNADTDGNPDTVKDGSWTPELERLVAQHPLRERMHAQLMRALYASGRQADALEAYRRARRILSDELGLEPGPELQYRVRCGPRLVTVS